MAQKCGDQIRKAKSHLELNLAGSIRYNKMGFSRYVR